MPETSPDPLSWWPWGVHDGDAYRTTLGRLTAVIWAMRGAWYWQVWEPGEPGEMVCAASGADEGLAEARYAVEAEMKRHSGDNLS
jgi:hypothetical protein